MLMIRNIRFRPYLTIAGFSLLLAACASAVAPGVVSDVGTQTVTAEPKPQAVDPIPTATDQPEEPLIDNDPFAGIRLRFNTAYWPDTDFTIHSIDYDEILSGGPPPDGIPAIDDPVFEGVNEADEWLGDDWPIMIFELNGDVRAYPLAILIHHEIVNDVVGDRPVALTFCPLCNATIAFDRTLPDGTLLDFGTTGNLRNSDLVMYDRQTKSWWQQFTGEAIVGELTGTQLEFLPSQIVAWSDFKSVYSNGKVLSRETGFNRPYGRNPYSGYDSINNFPFLYDGDLDGRLPPVERVVAIQLDGIDVAYPFTALSEIQVVNDEVAGSPLVVFWKDGTRTTFGNSDRDVGSTGVFNRQLDDQVLTFQAEDDGFRDDQTGSLWNIFGEAVDGPLTGQRLESIVAGEHFWFAWAVFRPDTIVWSPVE
jgi:hypothetical protein